MKPFWYALSATAGMGTGSSISKVIVGNDNTPSAWLTIVCALTFFFLLIVEIVEIARSK